MGLPYIAGLHPWDCPDCKYAATRQTTSTCYNYQRFTDCMLSIKNDHANIL